MIPHRNWHLFLDQRSVQACVSDARQQWEAGDKDIKNKTSAEQSLFFFHNVLAIILANPAFESFCSLCPFLGYLFAPGENDLTRSEANTAFQASSPLLAFQHGKQRYTSSSEEPSLGFESDAFRTSPEFLGIFKAAHRRFF